MNRLKQIILLNLTLFALLLSACSQEPPKEVCHITTGGSEYVFPEFTKEDCKKEVQSYHDKGIIDAEMTWKVDKH